ncbi:uncharacterized protein LOC143886771 [Tasmannia lanceolata]|uniref:uncharacterized protein LOC143886771 n=1 Tax=Tasmannia lanceolata TaxID=3420 RepID=UPI004064ABB7
MDLSSDLDEYIHKSIEYSLGLPVPEKTLELKLRASEDSCNRLRELIFLLQDRLKEKDTRIERSRAEASMNAQALKKYIEENKKLELECGKLISQCAKWENECLLYDRDREALMEFGNDAEERVKEAEIRALEAEESSRRLMEDLNYYRHECENHLANEARATAELHALRHKIDELDHTRLQGCDNDRLSCRQCSSLEKENHELRSHLLSTVTGDSSGLGTTLEEHLLDSVISSMLTKVDTTRPMTDEIPVNARSFLEAHTEVESCQSLLKVWESLKPSTKNILALACVVESLQNDKEHIRINLHRAEEEVKVLSEENDVLDEEIKRLLRQLKRERHHQGSGCKHTTSASSKGKRKSSPRTPSSVGKVIDFNGSDSPRKPLSPLQQNSPDCRMQEK